MIKLKEIVPFKKTKEILSKKTKNSYDYESSLKPFTFGVEFEFKVYQGDVLPEKDIAPMLKSMSDERLYLMVANDFELHTLFETFIDDKREKLSKEFIKSKKTSLSDWDAERYGPIPLGTYEDSNIEKDEREKKEIEYFNDIFHVNDLINNKNIIEFYNSLPVSKKRYFRKELANHDTFDFYIEKIINELKEKLKIDIRSERYNSNFWKIEKEGSGIEITSPILQNTENSFELLKNISEYIKTTFPKQTENLDFGIHVHIGMPHNFTYFDRFALYELMDEKSIEEIAPERVLPTGGSEAYNANKQAVQHQFLDSIQFEYNKENEFIIDDSDLSGFVPERQTGINIETDHDTVEFRYLGIKQMDVLQDWITYYMLITKLAQTRNVIVFKNISNVHSENYDIVLIRLPNEKIKVLLIKYKKNWYYKNGEKKLKRTRLENNPKINFSEGDLKLTKPIKYDKFKRLSPEQIGLIKKKIKNI